VGPLDIVSQVADIDTAVADGSSASSASSAATSRAFGSGTAAVAVCGGGATVILVVLGMIARGALVSVLGFVSALGIMNGATAMRARLTLDVGVVSMTKVFVRAMVGTSAVVGFLCGTVVHFGVLGHHEVDCLCAVVGWVVLVHVHGCLCESERVCMEKEGRGGLIGKGMDGWMDGWMNGQE